MGVKTGLPFGREGGSTSGRETQAVNKEWPCVFQGSANGRQAFMVLKATPRRASSGGESGGKRTKPGEGALRESFGEVGVDDARSF